MLGCKSHNLVKNCSDIESNRQFNDILALVCFIFKLACVKII